MDLSIVIVNYNSGALLRQCLRTIFANRTTFALEVIVIDNASRENLGPLVEEFSGRVRFLFNPDNVGFARAANAAIRTSSGRYIFVLNPDTEVTDGALERLVSSAEARPTVGALGCKVLNSDGTFQLACRRSIPSPGDAFFHFTGLSRLFSGHPRLARYNLTYQSENQSGEVEALSGSCMLLRRAALDAAGLFDESFFLFGEDLDLCLRIRQAGWQVFYDPAAVVIHHRAGSSRTRTFRTTLNFYHAMWIFYRKHYAAQNRLLTNALVLGGICTLGGLRVLGNWLTGRRAVGSKR